MATWKISTNKDGYIVNHKNSSGHIEFLGSRPPETPLQDLLEWVASEMDQEDLVTVNGQPVLQKFSAVVE
jgi:hypothetical protein